MSVAGQPWLKFYPADWRADPALRVCSIGARGLWMEMICLMHEAAPRGSLLISGRQVSDAQLAALVGLSRKLVASLISELEQAAVFSRDEDGTVYSRRMRRDIAKAERDKANGKTGGNPKLNPGVNPPDKAQKPEARSQREENECPKRVRTKHEYPSDFLEFWDAYPTDRNMGKPEALVEWRKLDPDDRRQAIASCPSFVAYCKADTTYRPIHANRYLAKRRFEGHAAAQTPSTREDQRIDFGGGFTAPWNTIRIMWSRGRWPDDWGPKPDEPGCRVPASVMEAIMSEQGAA